MFYDHVNLSATHSHTVKKRGFCKAIKSEQILQEKFNYKKNSKDLHKDLGINTNVTFSC